MPSPNYPEPDSTAPPIGLMPESIWQAQVNEDRIQEMTAAMGRYWAAGKPIPSAWIEEYNRRTGDNFCTQDLSENG